MSTAHEPGWNAPSWLMMARLKELVIAQASPKQKALFVALAHDLGYEAAVVKEPAKQHFGVASVNDLTTDQLSALIDRLLAAQAGRGHAPSPDQTELVTRRAMWLRPAIV